MKYCPYFFLLLFFIVSCAPKAEDTFTKNNHFSFPQNKIWAHRVNSLEEGAIKNERFEGLEVDLFYSKKTNSLFVAHDEKDIENEILFSNWLNNIPNPEKNWYWLDLKNLNKSNAKKITELLSDILNNFDIKSKTICESNRAKALYVLKNQGFAVSYWVNSIKDYQTKKEETNTKRWKRKIEKTIFYLNPDALSCHFWISPLLDTSFPNENIMYWHFPAEFTPKNVEITKRLCSIPNVKVVLVDYETPIAY